MNFQEFDWTEDDLKRIIRVLNEQVKRGGPSNMEEVAGRYMDEDLKALYLSIVQA